MDDYPLLRRQIVLKVCLATSRPLYLLAQRKRIKVQKLKHLLCLCFALGYLFLLREELRFETMGEDQTHGAEPCVLDAFTPRDKVLAENRAGERDIAQDLPVHHAIIICGLIACKVEHYLRRCLNIGNYALI